MVFLSVTGIISMKIKPSQDPSFWIYLLVLVIQAMTFLGILVLDSLFTSLGVERPRFQLFVYAVQAVLLLTWSWMMYCWKTGRYD